MSSGLAQRLIGSTLVGLITLPLLLRVSLCAAASQMERLSAVPDANQIVAQLIAMNARRAARLRSYRGLRLYELDYKGLPANKHAKMVVKIKYEVPDTEFEVISQEGSKLLLNRVLLKLLQIEREASKNDSRAETALNRSNYNFVLLGDDLVAGRKCYMLQVTPRRPSRFLYVGTVWVDADEFAVIRMKARPFKSPSFWITKTEIVHQYAKQGEFWLASTNLSTSSIRFGGQAVLKIDYRDYQVVPTDQEH